MKDNNTFNFKKAGFVLRPDSPEIKPLFIKIKDQFAKSGIEVVLSDKSASMIGEEGMTFQDMCEQSDFLVSLGGDGTLLSLVRRSYGYDKPVVGINAGNLGFLADVLIDEVDSFLSQLEQGDCVINERLMIEGNIITAEGTKTKFFSFNDVVVSKPVIQKMISLKAYVDNQWFNTYKGDALIISTPTGSTAYNMAAGGPIVYPLTKAYILSMVSAHSLTNQKPLVVPSEMELEFYSDDGEVVAVVDGQDHYPLQKTDVLKIKEAEKTVKLLHRKERNYFSVLREKLGWGDTH